ncbi:hypothetical protein PENSTE_c043G00835 [Penicillium steckii]
MRANS